MLSAHDAPHSRPHATHRSDERGCRGRARRASHTAGSAVARSSHPRAPSPMLGGLGGRCGHARTTGLVHTVLDGCPEGNHPILRRKDSSLRRTRSSHGMRTEKCELSLSVRCPTCQQPAREAASRREPSRLPTKGRAQDKRQTLAAVLNGLCGFACALCGLGLIRREESKRRPVRARQRLSPLHQRSGFRRTPLFRYGAAIEHPASTQSARPGRTRLSSRGYQYELSHKKPKPTLRDSGYCSSREKGGTRSATIYFQLRKVY